MSTNEIHNADNRDSIVLFAFITRISRTIDACIRSHGLHKDTQEVLQSGMDAIKETFGYSTIDNFISGAEWGNLRVSSIRLESQYTLSIIDVLDLLLLFTETPTCKFDKGRRETGNASRLFVVNFVNACVSLISTVNEKSTRMLIHVLEENGWVQSDPQEAITEMQQADATVKTIIFEYVNVLHIQLDQHEHLTYAGVLNTIASACKLPLMPIHRCSRAYFEQTIVTFLRNPTYTNSIRKYALDNFGEDRLNSKPMSSDGSEYKRLGILYSTATFRAFVQAVQKMSLLLY